MDTNVSAIYLNSFLCILQINFTAPEQLHIEPSNATDWASNSSSEFNNDTMFEDIPTLKKKLRAIQIAPVFLYCCAISLAAISAFLRSGFILKLIAMLVALIGQVTVLGYSDLFEKYNERIIGNG